MATLPSRIFSLIIIVFLFLIFAISMATPGTQDTLKPRQLLFCNDTLISANGRFELGFFTPSNITSISYLGIWYKDVTPQTVVWVANRMDPLPKSTASFVLDNHGNLVIKNGKMIWVTVTNLTKFAVNPTIQLLDSGNLVVQNSGKHNNGTVGGYIWESFDYPTDTLLPGMKIGLDFVDGFDRMLISWKGAYDPAFGDYTFKFDSGLSRQLFLRKDTIVRFRMGLWDGSRLSGTEIFDKNYVYKLIYVSTPTEVYLMYETLEDTLTRFSLTSGGNIQMYSWNNDSKIWSQMGMFNKDYCDQYNICGPNGICHLNEPNCRCLDGFEVSKPYEWKRMDHTSGCKRTNNLNCSSHRDGFILYDGLKLPDLPNVRLNVSLDECRVMCLDDCDCMAYTTFDLYRNGSHCVMWFGNLVDIKSFPKGGDSFYIRMPQIDIESMSHGKNNFLKEIGFILGLFFSILGLSCVVWRIGLTSVSNYIQADEISSNRDKFSTESLEEDYEVRTFDFRTLVAATQNFSLHNKIGQGGFGIVYKGELWRGQVAVKRLIYNSSQEGIKEFDNEVNLVSRLQHRNLVKLIGYCIEGSERLLVFEHLPNGSLDHLLFDEARRVKLSWEDRFKIIVGVAKGLVYLHDDSRLRVVHRDLKAGNILLDNEMIPKISDFGLARLAESEVQDASRRIGTNGYMSPELLMCGQFSTMSDIFSFGVLTLELISGKQNWGFSHPEHEMNLVGHAWKLWAEDRSMELVDSQLVDDLYDEYEVLRCIQLSLLCVQQCAPKRPTISFVLNVLKNESICVPRPRDPSFERGMSSSSLGFALSSRREPIDYESLNELTISTISGR